LYLDDVFFICNQLQTNYKLKITVMKKSLLILLFAFGLGVWGLGQSFSGTYPFTNVTTSSGTTDPTPVPTATGVIFGSFSATGTPANPNAGSRFSFTDWALDASVPNLTGVVNTAEYYSVTITPASGYTLDISSITFTIQRSSTGIRQYSVRSSLDSYTDNLPASINPANATLSVVATNVFQITDNSTAQNGSTVTLGSGFINLSTAVTFRFYGWNAEASGGTFSIDNVVISGSAVSAGGPIKLAITTINGSNSPSLNTPFNVVVQSQDASNIPANVTANTDFSLSLATGSGSLGGTLTGTISAGTSTATVTGVTYNTVETGVSITATRTSGDVLSPGTSALFTVLAAADHLVFVNVPSFGLVATILNTFTVEARRSDNTVDANYVSNITVTKATGSGNLTGTTVKTPVSGISTFNDLQFDGVDTYTLNATSGTLTSATSGNLEIVGAILAYRSFVSGNWNNKDTWEGYTGTQWIPSFDWPVSPAKDVTVRTDHSIIVPTSYNLGTAKNLTVESGATLHANASSGSCFVYVYGDIINDGTIGGASDVIGFDIEGTSCQLSGSGSFIAARIAKFTTANLTTNFTINQNVKLTYTSGSSAALRNGQSATTTFNIILGAGKQLTVPNAKIDLTGCTLTLKSDVTGTASLIDNGTISGQTGTNVTVERYLTEDKWHYVSAPVDDPTANVYYGIYMMEWDEPSGQWSYITDPDYIMSTDMEGYSIWSQSGMTGNATVSFAGNLNTGAKSIAVTATGPVIHNGYNFAGNPYPSSLNWNIDDGSGWSRTAGNIDLTIYIWNHTAGNYGSYVKDGFTGTNEVDSIVPPHQGFFVHCSAATGTLGVNNNARVHASKDILKSGEVANDLLKLRVEGNNYADEMIVHINPLASALLDQSDATKFFGSETAPQLYSLSKDNKELSINSFPIEENYMVIPVGLKVGADAFYTISVENFAGFEFSSGLYLEDLKEGTFTQLNGNATYSFTADPLDEPMRFLLHMNSGLALPENISGLNGVKVYSFNQDVYILSENDLNGVATIYDVTGREIINQNLTGITMTKVNLFNYKGYFIVNVITENGILNQKVFIR
jgi:hypothetical protein